MAWMHFTEVVRQDVGRHPDGSVLAAVDEQGSGRERAGRRALPWSHHPVAGVATVSFVDLGEQLHRQRMQPALGVSRRGRAEVGRPVVAVEVDQRIAQRERLGHADQHVVDRAVAVRVVARDGVPGDAGTLSTWPGSGGALVLHVPDDPAVHRLETVAHVGERPRHDDRHRVLEERVLHLVVEGDRLDRIVGWGGVVGVGHLSSVGGCQSRVVRGRGVRSRDGGRRGRWW